MRITVINTPHGLVPYGDSDYDEKRKLKAGEIYTADIKVARNVDFHRKYFAMISYAYEFLNEKELATFRTKDVFRKYLEVAAGHCDVIFHPRLQEYVEVPKSIAFDKLDDAGFRDIYGRVRDVIFSIIGGRVTEDEFERLLLDF